MGEAADTSRPALMVFSDDWGRHPSSCQHLVRRLLPRYRGWWVNTVGTRRPRLDRATLVRAWEKLGQWMVRPRGGLALPPGLEVLNPRMWPWFTRPHDRRINRKLLLGQLLPVIQSCPTPVFAVTTVPLVAGLIGELPVARWVYYCVDDFSQWPGLDQAAMLEMEEQLARRADVLVAVSTTLQERFTRWGRASSLLTHGVDLEHWQGGHQADRPPPLAEFQRPLVVYWGVIDRRMDVGFIHGLAEVMDRGTIVLVGPEADPDPALYGPARVRRVPAVPYEELPAIAGEAAVLIMPYAELPVTRAIQPLKMKEYLATGKPVVSRRLPSTEPWADALDVVGSAEEFGQAVLRRLEGGLPESQAAARRRLGQESWTEKARQFEQLALEPVVAEPPTRVVAGLPTEPPKRPQVSGRGGALRSDSRRGRETRAERRRETRAERAALETCPTGRPPLVLHTRVVCGTGGGPEKTILNSPRFLAPRGYDALCAYMHPPGDPGFEELRRRAEQLDAPLVGIEDRGPWDLRLPGRLLDLCRSRRVAVWHGHDYKSNALGLLLRRFWPMQLVSTVHGWGVIEGRTPLYYKIDRLCLRRYQSVICVSEDLLRTCTAAGVPADRCTVVANAIDCNQYARKLSTDEAKRRLGFDPGRLLVGSVGRLSDEKNLDGLIRVADRLLGDGLDMDLVLVGDGPQRDALDALVGELGRRDRVHLLGYRSDTIELYQALDAFVLASLREGLPNVVLEALAMGVPVVATRVAGLPGLIEHDADGLLIEPGDPDQLAAALRRLLEDPALRSRLAAAGRRTVEQNHSFAARMDRICEVYRRLLGEGE